MKQNLLQVSEVELIYRTKIKASERPQIKGAEDAHAILRAHWSDYIEMVEEFYVLFLNRQNRVTGICLVSRGGVAGTVVDAKIVFAAAIKALATSIILAHNHPSGNVQPSQQDIDLTRKLKRAGESLDIAVLDHLILTPHEGYYSFADESLI